MQLTAEVLITEDIPKKTFHGCSLFLHDRQMREEWVSEITNRDGLIILFVNYTFFSVIFLVCLLFMLCLANTTSSPNDLLMSMMLLATSFILVNMVIADYVVCTIYAHRDPQPIM